MVNIYKLQTWYQITRKDADVRLATSAGEDAGHQLGGMTEGRSLASVGEYEPLEGEELAAACVRID